MIPLKEDKYYVETEVEDDTNEFLRGRPSLSSITYNPNSRYNNSFIFEKINIMIDFYKKINKFNTLLILLVAISFILNCITIHYMVLIKGYVDKYVPKISSELDEAYIRFNEDSDQINYVSNIIQSDEFKQRYNKISEFVDIVSIDDVERINELIENVDPVEVGQLIDALCQAYDCSK
jgi:hypothetical protein|tara:strand:+ start:4257 stop:4790 length:534 start_codon:yes stop_codon:yes gene_type:complete